MFLFRVTGKSFNSVTGSFKIKKNYLCDEMTTKKKIEILTPTKTDAGNIEGPSASGNKNALWTLRANSFSDSNRRFFFLVCT